MGIQMAPKKKLSPEEVRRILTYTVEDAISDKQEELFNEFIRNSSEIFSRYNKVVEDFHKRCELEINQSLLSEMLDTLRKYKQQGIELLDYNPVVSMYDMTVILTYKAYDPITFENTSEFAGIIKNNNANIWIVPTDNFIRISLTYERLGIYREKEVQ